MTGAHGGARFDFAGRTAIVAGACGGIGRAVVGRFADSGANVVAADVDADALVALASGWSSPSALETVVCDVAREEGAAAATRAAIARFGRIDVLANVAGGSRPGVTADALALDDWRAVVDANLTSTFLLARAVIPHMARARGGAIVNVASGAGIRGMRRNPAYVAAKGGVVALTRALAMDHAADGIRVNCVSPGPVLTPLMERNRTPEEREVIARQSMSGRLGHPEELAAAIAFLASDAASYVNGETLQVDGGFATLV
ncbi:MAG: SDR family NAD(P)-dependent oxidoreductase [Myxococcota bacterium]